MLSIHDKLLLRDLKFQPVWLLWLYVVVGALGVLISIRLLGPSAAAVLGIGGGALVALGVEKLVSRRIRSLAVRLAAEGESVPAERDKQGQP